MAVRRSRSTPQSNLALLRKGDLPADVADAVIALVLVEPAALRYDHMRLVARIVARHYTSKSFRTTTSSRSFEGLVQRHGRSIALWLFLVACGVSQATATQETMPSVGYRALTESQSRTILENSTFSLALDPTVFSATQRTTFAETPAEIIANAYARAEQLDQPTLPPSTPVPTPSSSTSASVPSSVATSPSAPSFPTAAATIGPTVEKSLSRIAVSSSSLTEGSSTVAATSPVHNLFASHTSAPTTNMLPDGTSAVSAATPSAPATASSWFTSTTVGLPTPSSPSRLLGGDSRSFSLNRRFSSHPSSESPAKRPRVDTSTSTSTQATLERLLDDLLQEKKKELECDFERRFQDRERELLRRLSDREQATTCKEQMLDEREAQLQCGEEDLRNRELELNREWELLREVSEREREVTRKKKELKRRTAHLDEREAQLKQDQDNLFSPELTLEAQLATAASAIAAAQARLQASNMRSRFVDHLSPGPVDHLAKAPSTPTPASAPEALVMPIQETIQPVPQPQNSQNDEALLIALEQVCDTIIRELGSLPHSQRYNRLVELVGESRLVPANLRLSQVNRSNLKAAITQSITEKKEVLLAALVLLCKRTGGMEDLVTLSLESFKKFSSE